MSDSLQTLERIFDSTLSGGPYPSLNIGGGEIQIDIVTDELSRDALRLYYNEDENNYISVGSVRTDPTVGRTPPAAAYMKIRITPDQLDELVNNGQSPDVMILVRRNAALLRPFVVMLSTMLGTGE